MSGRKLHRRLRGLFKKPESRIILANAMVKVMNDVARLQTKETAQNLKDLAKSFETKSEREKSELDLIKKGK